MILVGFAGAMGGFVSWFQKISTSVSTNGNIITGSFDSLSTLYNAFTLFWILLSISFMIVLQFAHKNGQPFRIIPAFIANYIIVLAIKEANE